MRAFLLVAFVFIQLLSTGFSQNNFNNPPTQRPIYIDHVPQDPNRRYARSNNDDFREVFDREVGSVMQEEIHKVVQEAMSDKEHSYENKEHERVRRNTGPMPRPPPPPPPRPFMPPYITDDIRGYNRRWARETHLDEQIEPEILRERRDLQIPGFKKPTHRDVIIPNWNPNARTQPWQTIGVRRHRRDLQEEQEQLNVEELNDELSEFEEHSRVARGLNQNFGDRGVLINRPRVPHPDSAPRWRNRRDLQIPGYKKPTHRDIIIPNWNPNVRTQPWQHIGGRH